MNEELSEEELKAERRRAGRAARNKGAVGEREVCALLEKLTGNKHSRNLNQTRDAGGDIDYGPFLLEVKRQERLKMTDWQEQATVSASDAGKLPAIVYRRSKEDWWFACRFEDIVLILEALKKS